MGLTSGRHQQQQSNSAARFSPKAPSQHSWQLSQAAVLLTPRDKAWGQQNFVYCLPQST